MAIVGGTVRVLCYRALGQMFTYELTIRDKHKLVTKGPYSVVRHPGYTALMTTILAVPLYAVSPGTYWAATGLARTPLGIGATVYWSLLTMVISTFFVRAYKEEEALALVFGKEWEDYARRVRYRFVPGII
jgi:protein-S-isoprenylcysteine O-methyltransferase Ste14